MINLQGPKPVQSGCSSRCVINEKQYNSDNIISTAVAKKTFIINSIVKLTDMAQIMDTNHTLLIMTMKKNEPGGFSYYKQKTTV